MNKKQLKTRDYWIIISRASFNNIMCFYDYLNEKWEYSIREASYIGNEKEAIELCKKAKCIGSVKTGVFKDVQIFKINIPYIFK